MSAAARASRRLLILSALRLFYDLTRGFLVSVFDQSSNSGAVGDSSRSNVSAPTFQGYILNMGITPSEVSSSSSSSSTTATSSAWLVGRLFVNPIQEIISSALPEVTLSRRRYLRKPGKVLRFYSVWESCLSCHCQHTAVAYFRHSPSLFFLFFFVTARYAVATWLTASWLMPMPDEIAPLCVSEFWHKEL